MLLFISWIIWSIINGFIASSNRRNVAGVFFASLLLSPLFIFLYLLAVGKNDMVPDTTPVTNHVDSPADEPVNLPMKPRRLSALGTVGVIIFISLILVFAIAFVRYLNPPAIENIDSKPVDIKTVAVELAPIPTVKMGHVAWISGFDSCVGSKEYGQIVAPVVVFYTSFDVDLSQRFGTIPHGMKIDAISFFNGMQRIHYDNHIGFVQDMFVVSYDPATGVRPSTAGCR